MGCGKNGANSVATNPKILFSPPHLSLTIGAQKQLNLNLQNLDPSIFALSLQIAYNDSFLAFDDALGADKGDFFDPEAILFVKQDSSIIHLTLTQIQGRGEVQGSGVLGVFTFTGKATGSSAISMLAGETHFFNAGGSEITIPDLEFEAAEITVN